MGSQSYIFVFFVFLALLSESTSTLSKADKNAKKKDKATKNTKTEIDVAVTADEILKNYMHVDFKEEKKFPNPTLGYVTPWNGHGYDVAKWLAHKFTHISPVWFQIVPKRDTEPPTCTIEGTHDMDQGWIKDVRSNNSDIKIVPRFLFEKWSPPELQQLFGDELLQERCAKAVIDFLQRNKFDGGVVEIWIQVMSMSQGSAVRDLLHFIINWAEMFQYKDQQFILPVPPPLDASGQESGIFTEQHFAALVRFVDYINVMTYDFPDRKIGPVAPLDWVRKCVEWLLSGNPDAAPKLLMGLNFYGHERRTKIGSAQPVTGNDFVALLKSKTPEIFWHRTAAEHYVQSDDHICYYPSLASVEARLKLAKELNVGVGIWEIGQGLDYFYNLF